ncbi:hypothetical protein TGAM01_v207220 [Trichoderma gamsii]|uniref:Uncharacterized protein n=1 Tax=Trichoderma gamsii TaxID=398673 RepID=A0A2P4ZHY7_9HYPO|nr:hypothetical protein TGAM01_v207220 [Trichoderma gamsii]PON23892.1 hypothetical protein TGAM01_v207220 [Trichoderma gamsii]
MWDRARASATAGLDRMHRRHLTGTAGGFSSTSTAGYNDRPGADRKHAGDAATPMSWTTISTSTSSSTFYQTNVDGPANALGIEIANTATAPQRPQRPQADAPSARVTSALHTGIISTDDLADSAASLSHPGFEPPPRNPRRLLQQYSKDSTWSLATPANPEPQIVTDSESNYTSDGDGYSSSPAPNFKLAAMYSRRRPPALDQISPPSSPETGAFKYDAPVSPIDDEDADFRENPFQGNQRQQPFTTPRHMTDRPIQSHQYRAYQPPVEPMPLTFEDPRGLADVPAPHVALPRSNKMRLPTVNETSVAQRFKFLTKGAATPTENLSDRPTRGGPGEAPVHIPRRSSKRISRTYNGPRNISAPLPSIQSSSELETPPREQAIPDRDLLPSARAQRTQNTSMNPSSFTPQNVNSINSLPTPPPNQRYPTPQSMESVRAQSPSIAELTPTALRIIKRKPAQNHQAEPAPPANPSTSSPAYINPPPRRASAAAATTTTTTTDTGLNETAPQRTNVGETWTQPPSRFSVTTYATSNAGTPQQPSKDYTPTMTNSTVPVVTRPGPYSKQEIHNAPSASHTITMPKQRAQMSSPYGAGNQIAVSSEASLSGPAPHGRTVSNMESSRRSSIMSMSKPLPPAPPELASSPNDRIAQLRAVLSGLARRKVNISKSIQQMTELMPRDNLMASEEVLRKREVEKQKIQGLKQELAEIQHEEYDLGLKLHRAYKRQEKDAEYEPTTLWVRRITTN